MAAKILVLGSNGQLGQCIQQYASKHLTHFQFIFTDRTQIDICDALLLREQLIAYQPEYVINCTAYTAVDKAESEQAKADEINHLAVKNLALICKDINATLLHISTDFVFDGTSNTPISEEAPCAALGVYGQTKLDGEQAIIQHGHKYFIIRTSWLYSNIGANFFTNISKYARERDALNIVYDQVGTPTYTMDLVQALIAIIQSNSKDYGIYHYSNEGVCSWYDFAVELVHMQDIDCKIAPILSAQYPTPAKRPAYSVLNKSKIKNSFSLTIPHWRESLARLIEQK